jgi:hypothetical protein
VNIAEVETFNNQVFNLIIFLNDKSKENYEAIKTNLEKKYGKEVDMGLDGIVFGGTMSCFRTQIDGIPIVIALQHN